MMEENTSYNNNLKQLPQVPVPDKEVAWQKMKMLLEEDKKKRGTLLFLPGCLLIALLLAMLSVLYFLGKNGKKEEVPERDISKRSKSEMNVADSKKVPLANFINPDKENSKAYAVVNKKEAKVKNSRAIEIASLQKAPFKTSKENKPDMQFERLNNQAQQSRTIHSIPDSFTAGKQWDVDRFEQQNSVAEASVYKVFDTSIKTEGDTTSTDRYDKLITSEMVKNDLRGKAVLSRPTRTTIRYSFGAGLGLQQQVPFNGQKAASYNYYGRESSLADYIPSVYLGLYQNRKWFVQSELRYGAPQYTREFTYREVNLNDTIGSTPVLRRRRSLTLKKTFYHQASLSFHYYIRPSWSIGAGITYNRFSSAVSEEVIRRINLPVIGDTIMSTKTLQVKPNEDTAFTKSHSYLLLETQYQVRRFAFGFRYTMGLEPYIRYIQQGQAKQEKNMSVHLFMRYQLFKLKIK